MKKIERFINQYPLSKTLRFKAIPIGKTAENLRIKNIIETDRDRAEKYKLMKEFIDRYHKFFIEERLSEIQKLVGLEDYIELYLLKSRTDDENDEMIRLEEELRKQISDSFTKSDEYKNLVPKKLIADILPEFLNDAKEIEIVDSFDGFATAFEGFRENRENLYSADAKASSIAYRSINDNLPRFIANAKVAAVIKEAFGEEKWNTINDSLADGDFDFNLCFAAEAYPYFLSNKAIVLYNGMIGGYTLADGTIIQGLNQYINNYNQNLSKSEKSKRLPLLKPMYKQLLSDRASLSFIQDEIADDDALVRMLYDITAPDDKDGTFAGYIENVVHLIHSLNEYDANGIFTKNGVALTELSNGVTGAWSTFSAEWNKEYDALKMKKAPKDIEKYEEERRKAFNRIRSFSFHKISDYLNRNEQKNTVYDYLNNRVDELYTAYQDASQEFVCAIPKNYRSEYRISRDERKVEVIKNYLDSIKAIETFVKLLQGTGVEENRDEVFYGEYLCLLDNIATVDPLYNAIRNYLTKKPYSDDKFRLYFNNPQIMNGWDINKENDYLSALLRKEDKYYVAILNKGNSKVLREDVPALVEGEASYGKMIYKQIPNAAKYISSKQIVPQNPPANIIDILDKKKKSGDESLTKAERATFIDYCANDFLVNYSMLRDENGENYFSFHFKKPEEYASINEFFMDVDSQGYAVKFKKVSAKYIDECVESGKIFLFQLYNKDFSEYSKGTPNLHTLYFKELFSEENLAHPIIGLSGGAEFFYRPASIGLGERTIHPKNQAIANKNPLNEKRSSVFDYDIVKDKRYTDEHYEIHLPIKINCTNTAKNNYSLNEEVRKALRTEENPYVIGIDRGERNLLYLCVVDGKGNLVEQISMNEIINHYNETEYRTDYHDLLDRKEKGRTKARQDWSTIENIKELKDGYISQVVHKICELVDKYDAVIAMEDLNSGFKNSRVKVEKQVYQKFEKALIEKFNYLCDKNAIIGMNGSINKGYQIANKFESFKKMSTQNGFIFYIPAWLTSKIDPVTGFADLIKPKYESVAEAKRFIMSFDSICYLEKEHLFEFVTDMTRFARTDADYRKQWTICSNGTRIKTFRNPEKNNEFDNQEVVLTDAFIDLFNKNGIAWKIGDLREQLVKGETKEFYERFIGLVRLMLQMRNSITGRTDVDYLISPVRGNDGTFFDSRSCKDNLPQDADANGAYNIARKVLWAIEQFKQAEECDVKKVRIAMKNAEWLEYAQTRE